MKRLRALVLVPLILLLVPSSAFSLSNTGGHFEILSLTARAAGIRIQLVGFTNPSATVVCATNGIYLTKTTANYDTMAAFLLSAFLNQRKVKIWFSACTGSDIKVAIVGLSRGQ